MSLCPARDIFIPVRLSGAIGSTNANSFATEDESDQLGEDSQPAGSKNITISSTEASKKARGRDRAGEAEEKEATGGKEKTGEENEN